MHMKLSDRLYQYIKDEKLRSGNRLPGERKLAVELNVSRPTLREAIKELENKGIVKSEVGKGTYVTDVVENKQFRIKMASQNFLELFEIKIVLERYCLEKIVPLIKEEQLQHLESVALQMNAIAATGIMPTELDDQFHQDLLACYNNKELANLVIGLTEMYAIFTKDMKQYFEDEKFDYYSILLDTIPYHFEMVQMMEARNIPGTLEKYDKIIECDLKIYKKNSFEFQGGDLSCVTRL